MKRAFTLIEVMVALAVLAIVTISVFPLLTGNLKKSAELENKTRVLYHGQGLMEYEKARLDNEDFKGSYSLPQSYQASVDRDQGGVRVWVERAGDSIELELQIP